MYACQCFLPLLRLKLKLMYWLHFWELLFNASKNMQANIRPFLWFCMKLIPLKPDSVLTVPQLQWLTTNLTSTLSFLKRFSKDLTEAESMQHQRCSSYQPNPNSMLPRSLIALLLKQVCPPKILSHIIIIKLINKILLFIVLVIAMIYAALIRWHAMCHVPNAFFCIQSLKEGVYLDFITREVKAHEDIYLQPHLKQARAKIKSAVPLQSLCLAPLGHCTTLTACNSH